MKMNHLYFDKYCTRTVTFENSPGVFHLNGEPIQREQLEEETTKHHRNRQIIPRDFGSSTVISELTSPQKRPTIIQPTFTTQSRTLTASKHHSLHPEEVEELRKKEVAKLKHIYNDDNFVRINRENKETLLTGKRTWLGSNNLHNHTVACMTSVVKTAVPQNKKQLNLTHLRQYGGGQDKPHHIKPANESRRMKIDLR